MRTTIYILFGLWRTLKWCLKMAGIGLGLAFMLYPVKALILLVEVGKKEMATGGSKF
jgi:hypothetical protein